MGKASPWVAALEQEQETGKRSINPIFKSNITGILKNPLLL